MRSANSHHYLYFKEDNTKDLSEKLGILFRNTQKMIKERFESRSPDFRSHAHLLRQREVRGEGSLGEVLDHLGYGETGVYHRYSLTFTLISEFHAIAGGHRSGGICLRGPPVT